METRILEEIGLTKTEIKIYLALLKSGQTTTTEITKESGVPTSKVYEFLNRLIEKGLVSYVIKSNKKHFSASNPNQLKEIINEKRKELSEKEKDLEKVIPKLNSIKSSKENRIKSEIYEGIKGVKSVYEKILTILKKGETQYILGAPKIANDLVEGYLLGWHKRRIKRGIKCKYIYNYDAKEYGKIREKMSLTSVKYLPKDMISPTWVEIFGSFVLIGHMKGKETNLILIEDKEISKSYLNYFNLIWHIKK